MEGINAYNQNAEQLLDNIIAQHTQLVKRIAHHLIGRLPNYVQVDDLIQAGMIGLIEAAKNYDSTKGASFETYAGIRIRGMMIDEVRRNDWLPRSVYRNSRKITEAIRDVENKQQTNARDVDVAKTMDLSLDDYHTLLREVNSGQLYSFDDIGMTDDVLSQSALHHSDEPLVAAQREDFHNILSEAIEKLPEREQLVLSLYYDEELNLKEIGEVLGVSESRICQIHSQAMRRVQAKIPDWTR